MKLVRLFAYEILASGGYPTLEVEAVLDNGASGRASVPYGASAGSYEATVLVDMDAARWQGQGMLQAVGNVLGAIAEGLIGKEVDNPRAVDEVLIGLDGTSNKARLGGNAILAVSLATARAVASAKNQELYQHIVESYGLRPDFKKLPHPMVVAIEGGKHADETTDLQEYCMLGVQPEKVSEAVRQTLESYHSLKKVLRAANLSTNVGNEGAFAPNGIASNEAPFAFMSEAILGAGYTPGQQVAFAVDAAASEYFSEGRYQLKLENKSLSSEEIIGYYEAWFEKYPILTFEDPLHEDDWDNWKKMKTVADKHNIFLIGDDLTVTSKERLQKAIDMGAISAILIKLNQIGTLTETIDCCELARKHGLATVTSHRGGGETNDAAMIDVAVAVGSAYVKVGPTRGERVSKYNRLMEIERQVKSVG